MTQTSTELGVAKRALATVASAGVSVAVLPDVELMASVALAEEVARQLDVVRARFAAQLSVRSEPELGHAGLAARQGELSAETLLRRLTRSSFRDVARRIRVGKALVAAEASRDLENGLSPFDAVASAVHDGELGIEAADQVIRALEPVTAEVDPEMFRQATVTLVNEAATRDADEVGRMARGARDTLDRIGVADREEQLRSRRSLRRSSVIDGMRRVTLMLDPESDAVLSGAIDAAMSPRFGGPRFVDATARERAARLIDDERSNEQMALDVLLDLVRIGVDQDDGHILGSHKPGLRVTIPLADLLSAVDERGREHPSHDSGVAWLEGGTEPLSAATARRILCESGALPIVLSGAGEPLDLGRTRRLFSGPQRVALANRDGGCRWPGCDRPPSWAEAHHINPFGAGGKTDLADGLLLCRRHHLLLHNHGWRVERAPSDGEFVLIPPMSVDPAQLARPMPSKLPPWLRSGRIRTAQVRTARATTKPSHSKRVRAG